MTSKESFKDFVSKHPELIKYVNDGKNTWQQFYEMYDLYGEESKIWDNYAKTDTNETTSEILKFVKNINLDKLQSGMESIQRVISLISEIGTKNDENIKEEYTPRPMYKHFED